MSRNPIATQNVYIGFDAGDVEAKDTIIRSMYPESEEEYVAGGGTLPQPSVDSFSKVITDLAKNTSGIFASTQSNLITFEHSYNFDGQNTEPKFKVKVLDVDDNIVKQFLELMITYDTTKLEEELEKGTLKPDKDGKLRNVEVGKDSIDDWVVFKPKLTPVWVTYGSGDNPSNWVGPFDGYVTDVQLTYDANLIRQYEITIHTLATTGPKTTALKGGTGWQLVTKLYFDDIVNNRFQWAIEELFTRYLKLNMGAEVQFIILLPNVNEYLRRVSTDLVRLSSKFSEVLMEAWGYGTGTDRSRARDAFTAEREVMRDILGVLGFIGGESKFSYQEGSFEGDRGKGILTETRGFAGGTIAGGHPDQTFPLRFMDRITGADVRYRDMLRKNPATAYIADAAGDLGIETRVDYAHPFPEPRIGPRDRARSAASIEPIAIKILGGPENSDPVDFFHKFIRNLDQLISDYTLNSIVMYESDHAIKKFWERLGIIDDANKPVVIVGDALIISNYLYGDIAVYEHLQDALEADISGGNDDPQLQVMLKLVQENLQFTKAVKLPQPAPTNTAGDPIEIEREQGYAIDSKGNAVYPRPERPSLGDRPADSYYEPIWSILREPTYRQDMFTLLAKNPKASYHEAFGLDFAGVEDFTTASSKLFLKVAIHDINHEFRAGYPNSNIVSFEHDISKYLLANLFRVSKTAAVKDFREKF